MAKFSSGYIARGTVTKEDIVNTLVNTRSLEALRVENKFSHAPLVSLYVGSHVSILDT